MSSSECEPSELEMAFDTALNRQCTVRFGHLEMSTTAGHFVPIESTRPEDIAAAFIELMAAVEESFQ